MAMNGKKLRRKSKSAAVYVPVAAIFILLLGVLGTSVFLRILEIEVIGESKYSKEEIITASGIAQGVNRLRVKAREIPQKISSELPYINSVEVKYHIPDKVQIIVSESSALAMIECEGGIALIDAKGRVLEYLIKAPGGLIEIRGFTPAVATVGAIMTVTAANETKFNYMKEILNAMVEENIADEVALLDVSNISHINFIYQGTFTVAINTMENLRHKLSILPDIVENNILANDPDDRSGTISFSDNAQWRWIPNR
jgi:cell division septal protein FtsQ